MQARTVSLSNYFFCAQWTSAANAAVLFLGPTTCSNSQSQSVGLGKRFGWRQFDEAVNFIKGWVGVIPHRIRGVSIRHPHSRLAGREHF